MSHALIFDERSLTKVAGVFARAPEARAAAQHVMDDAQVRAAQIRIVGPEDPALEQKLEPEQRGIFRTMIKAHVTLGVAGLFLGLLCAWVLILGGVEFAVGSPYYTLGVVASFGMIAGLLLGGLVTLRPDHTLLISKVQSAVREGRWAVVVHPRDRREARRAAQELKRAGGDVVRTL